MHIAILTFEGYNELDSLIALGVLNRVKTDGWRVTIAAPVGEKEEYTERAWRNVTPYLSAPAPALL